MVSTDGKWPFVLVLNPSGIRVHYLRSGYQEGSPLNQEVVPLPNYPVPSLQHSPSVRSMRLHENGQSPTGSESGA